MRRAFARSIAASLALLVAGCVTVDETEYPAWWPALALAASGCPDLTGTFDNADVDDREPRPLAKWLVQTADPLRQVHRVALDGPRAGTLRLRLLDADGATLLVDEWREGRDYRCQDGWLERRQPELSMLGVVNRHVARLARSNRGDVVVQDTDVGGGVVLVVPMLASFRSWHLYRQRGH